MKLVMSLLIFILVGCSTSITNEDLRKLNGYWEIDTVTFYDGTKKAYPKANTTIDYIVWDGSKGFRKKVYPKLDGTFNTSNDAEAFEIVNDDSEIIMRYANTLSKWQETLIALQTDTFSVRNDKGVTYTYRRHQTINLSQ